MASLRYLKTRRSMGYAPPIVSEKYFFANYSAHDYIKIGGKKENSRYTHVSNRRGERWLSQRASNHGITHLLVIYEASEKDTRATAMDGYSVNFLSCIGYPGLLL